MLSVSDRCIDSLPLLYRFFTSGYRFCTSGNTIYTPRYFGEIPRLFPLVERLTARVVVILLLREFAMIRLPCGDDKTSLPVLYHYHQLPRGETHA